MPDRPLLGAMPRIQSPSIKEPTNVTAVARRRGAHPSPEAIRVRAYEIYLARGAQPGRDAEDWAQAERELRAGPAVVVR
ncbi:MAG: hypothetical protein QOI63_1815 [Thermoplasmata archaeon]|jgi:hypothetical protein|nr:hypothetical protein [Thermoplasmata archaeon]